MTLSEATELYQAALEQSRANPSDDQLAELATDAHAVMERLWLKTMMTRTTYGS